MQGQTVGQIPTLRVRYADASTGATSVTAGDEVHSLKLLSNTR